MISTCHERFYAYWIGHIPSLCDSCVEYWIVRRHGKLDIGARLVQEMAETGARYYVRARGTTTVDRLPNALHSAALVELLLGFSCIFHG